MSEWCRCGADMKKPRMGSTKAYVPFGALIERPRMTSFHNKLLDAYAIKNEVHILEVVLEGEA